MESKSNALPTIVVGPITTSCRTCNVNPPEYGLFNVRRMQPDGQVRAGLRSSVSVAQTLGGLFRTVALFCSACTVCQLSFAQVLAPPSDASIALAAAADDHAEIAAPSDAELPQTGPFGVKVITGGPGNRLFGIIPNYRADQYQAAYKPLTIREKYRIARSDSFDWPNYFLLAGYAVQSQVASGGFRHNGGIPGFAKFYARSVGDQIIGSYLTEAILPSILHEDPRFFRLGRGSIIRRASYAASRVFITRRDNGVSGLNFSELVGNSGVTALTSLYYPNSRAASEGLERFGMQLGNDMISNLLTEFWPDIKRHLPFRRGASDGLPRP